VSKENIGAAFSRPDRLQAIHRKHRSTICNDPDVNRHMIEQGKQKMDHLRQLGTIDEQVMVKLYDIITPLDEREDYRASVTKAAGQEVRAKKLEKLMSAAD
jgi:hypothetical protein